ncbi:sodium/hydrogen exchanger [Streptomyces zinciresistens K42]|uniref:Sodium/hydrogen exchanger n=1 Tax=Streptomyces zinciresistens K42 TaxID=700597 RepID=G2GEE9_9ACTN|nr:cation:proton antiporter [Streptomyces zinciresistens]EGX58124.1 sodium/hydrogen exchanger [Streptomyces zinciresistens K42]
MQTVQLAAVDPNVQLVIDVLPAVLVVLVLSALCGRLFEKVGQPRVLGEMVAGILLGPTLLGRVAPGVQDALFSAEVKPVLYVLSTIGLTLFMFLVGVGLDHHTAPRGYQGTAVSIAVASILPAMAAGCGVGLLFYDSLSLKDVSPSMFAVFIGGALAVTAFPILARMLYDNGLERSALGMLALLAAAVDDAVAWCLLAFLIAFHKGGGFDESMRTVLLSVVFTVVVMTVGRRLLARLGERVERSGTLTSGQFCVVLVSVLGAGLITERIGIYAVFGGFLVGLAMPRGAVFRRALRERLLDTVQVLLVPIFFAFSGLNTRIAGFTDPGTLLPLASLVAAAFVGKYAGCIAVMRWRGFSWREGSAMGSLMNARGLMILVFINVGFAQGVIGQKVFSLLVLVALVTTASALPLCKLSLGGKLPPVDDDDQNRAVSVSVDSRTSMGGIKHPSS